jgi:hypothetical protein
MKILITYREEKDRKRKADQKTREDEKKKHQQHQNSLVYTIFA